MFTKVSMMRSKLTVLFNVEKSIMTKSKEDTPLPGRLSIRKEKSQPKKEGLKSKKWSKLARRHLFYRQAGRWFLGFVIAPWACSAMYYTGIASERYVSEASFMIEKSDSGSASVEGLSLFGVTPQAGNDQRILEAFIKSPDMMYFLDEQAGLRKHYSEEADILSRLSPNASHESFLQFYRDHLRIRFNDTNGMLDLETQGFTPEFAQNLAQLILERSEAFVNEISHSLAAEQLNFVQQEVELSEQQTKRNDS